ncbi:head-tail connector protein [Veillonella intestinalis]|uniref:head-tail connector protein n=1 Tax=Veillonella intestinalis TaxID=2941341 RepID=UPI00203EE10B|nr:head-tail connector protein [Veillonella intestinalis]
MISLSEVKNYLRIDYDLVDEDKQVELLINAAIGYIESTTGKKYVEDSEIMDTLLLLLVSHWYSNRNMANKSTAILEFPHTITSLIHTIKYNTSYKAVES